jgi:DUF1009 family protein
MLAADALQGKPEPIGLIAGNGQFPLLFAQAARARGIAVVAVAMRGETQESLREHVDEIVWVKVGELGKMIRGLKRAGIRHAAMAGGVDKTRLFRRARPDFLGLWLLARTFLRRDDGLLRAVAQQFEAAGITIVDSTLYMPEALAPHGVLTAAQPTPRQWQDLRYGLEVAQAIGRLDIGQTVVVKEGAVVALEAIEGTDACIRRAGALTHRQHAVVVKVAKPAQDMRFDVPAVGVATLESMRAAGVTVLGIEAERTLLLQPDAFVQRANYLGMVIVGLRSAPAADHPASLSTGPSTSPGKSPNSYPGPSSSLSQGSSPSPSSLSSPSPST